MAGIGGRTVAEAKCAMSLDEFYAWQAYRLKWGTFNLGARLEWLHARQVVHAAGVNRHGKPVISFEKVLRYPHEPQPEKYATHQDIMREIGMRV